MSFSKLGLLPWFLESINLIFSSESCHNYYISAALVIRLKFDNIASLLLFFLYVFCFSLCLLICYFVYLLLFLSFSLFGFLSVCWLIVSLCVWLFVRLFLCMFVFYV